MISVKVYKRGAETLLAACDTDLLGRTFRSEGLRLDVTSSFYSGEECDEAVFVNRLQIATTANLVGRRTVEMAVKHGFVDAACVMTIGGVPHAQMTRMM